MSNCSIALLLYHNRQNDSNIIINIIIITVEALALFIDIVF